MQSSQQTKLPQHGTTTASLIKCFPCSVNGHVNFGGNVTAPIGLFLDFVSFSFKKNDWLVFLIFLATLNKRPSYKLNCLIYEFKILTIQSFVSNNHY